MPRAYRPTDRHIRRLNGLPLATLLVAILTFAFRQASQLVNRQLAFVRAHNADCCSGRCSRRVYGRPR